MPRQYLETFNFLSLLLHQRAITPWPRLREHKNRTKQNRPAALGPQEVEVPSEVFEHSKASTGTWGASRFENLVTNRATEMLFSVYRFKNQLVFQCIALGV